MRSCVFSMLTKFGAIQLWAVPTRADELHCAGKPETSFTRAGHSEGVNASRAPDNRLTCLAQMEVGVGQFLNRFPQLARYDAKTGRVTRTEDCRGVRLEIDFSRNYVLVSFHDHPPANAFLVDHRLGAIKILFGFAFCEVAPDRVALATEKMIHFAPAHHERLSWGEGKEKQPCCA